MISDSKVCKTGVKAADNSALPTQLNIIFILFIQSFIVI